MKSIMPIIDSNLAEPLYLQLYNYIKKSILSQDIASDEKLPSLRSLSSSLHLSLTTVELAYNQLAVEGYIYSKPQSGYFVSKIYAQELLPKDTPEEEYDLILQKSNSDFIYDLSCFDFNKWKKCFNKIISEHSSLLLFESDPQGEEALRFEIAKYIYQSRGVKCFPSQVVIAAGTQQITSHLSTILNRMSINHVAVESPGYLPVTNIFRDRSFSITPVSVKKDGMDLTKLPRNIPCATYVSPSNQFPSGTIMPINKRYELISWAEENHSYIIEDDYDSELRYFGKPVPSLQGLDTTNRVIYLGSFSSTLFPSIKISYMVLPEKIMKIFDQIRDDYSQTCSKAEQLTLALFMEKGYYQIGIKKLRRLYSQKLQATHKALSQNNKVQILNSSSGVNIIINVNSHKNVDVLCKEAEELGILMVPLVSYTEEDSAPSIIFYYNKLPLSKASYYIDSLLKKWFS